MSDGQSRGKTLKIIPLYFNYFPYIINSLYFFPFLFHILGIMSCFYLAKSNA